MTASLPQGSMVHRDKRKTKQTANFSILLLASLVHSQNPKTKKTSRSNKQSLHPNVGA